MGYNSMIKEKVLKEVDNGICIKDVAKKYHMHWRTIYNWLSEASGGNTAKHQTYSLKEKCDVITQIESGKKDIREIAAEAGIKAYNIRNWIKDKNHIYAVYYTEKQCAEAEGQSFSAKEKHDMDPKNEALDEHLENKALREENQYLKAKVMYLEKLMELNGTPAPDFKKKQGIGLSGKSPKEKD